MDKYLDDLPIEILEVYDAIEKLLAPGKRIVEENKAVSNSVLYMLKSLHKAESTANKAFCPNCGSNEIKFIKCDTWSKTYACFECGIKWKNQVIA